MDNLTHSLVGVLLARGTERFTRSRRAGLWVSVLASNAPDIDVFFRPFYADPAVGGLVHHRGYTHTVLGALTLAGLVTLGVRRLVREGHGAALAGLGALAALLHIGADAWNDYGVHPFWPVDDTWRYGDTIFILEPWLWAALMPLLWDTAKRARWVLGVGALQAGAIAWLLGPVPAAVWLGAVVAFARAPTVLPATLGVFGTLVAFRLGHDRADTLLRERVPEPILDVSLSPRPTAPWCWLGWVLTDADGTYRARNARVSLLPSLVDASTCGLDRGTDRTAPTIPGDLASDASVHWNDQFVAPAAELGALAAQSCRVDAFLHFARVPFWTVAGDHAIVGDLRYDFEPEVGFAEVDAPLGPNSPCPAQPPWQSDVVRALAPR